MGGFDLNKSWTEQALGFGGMTEDKPYTYVKEIAVLYSILVLDLRAFLSKGKF